MSPGKPRNVLTKSASSNSSLRAVRYEQTVQGEPPIPVIIAPPRSPPTDTHPAFRRPLDGIEERDLSKRDSGLAPTESTAAREGSMTAGDEAMSATAANTLSLTSGAMSAEKPNSSKLANSDKSVQKSKLRKGDNKKESNFETSQSGEDRRGGQGGGFSPLTIPIPTESQLELDFMDQITFSNRGSVLLKGKKFANGQPKENTLGRDFGINRVTLSTARLLSEELERESWKVRSMYENEQSTYWENGRLSPIGDNDTLDEEAVLDVPELTHLEPSITNNNLRPGSSLTAKSPGSVKMEHELAGGIEDWEDISGDDVDRYGFITVRNDNESRDGVPEPKNLQRMSTALQMASQAPRQRRGLGRTLSSSRSSRSGPRRTSSRKVSSKSIYTEETVASLPSASRSRPFRSAANLLPGNRNRRWMDEASDMLTLPPGLADIAEEEEGGNAAQGAKKKEWDRTEKWRKMAKVVKIGNDGEGMEFDFDVRSPKLVERTWKGIPDRWRASAWYSFLSASARKKPGAVTDKQIVDDFHNLLQQSSSDDVQIDMDVPRTINSHIMFRRRYRGGQRLLFRVLHALSLYFPETGYVQGMASLAATLLCYYDEDKAFVMLVRMWQVRGLDKLYEVGFSGLMAALDEFQKDWMQGHNVSKKLDELGIEPTAYGTRWYLTLFNYSIPFAAQLRVWDVFMLLGDAEPLSPPNITRPFDGSLDVLHAAGAALIDGTREILLDSDFENAMKALTSWIPVKDEDLFMKVAKAEWKLHHGKKRR